MYKIFVSGNLYLDSKVPKPLVRRWKSNLQVTGEQECSLRLNKIWPRFCKVWKNILTCESKVKNLILRGKLKPSAATKPSVSFQESLGAEGSAVLMATSNSSVQSGTWEKWYQKGPKTFST